MTKKIGASTAITTARSGARAARSTNPDELITSPQKNAPTTGSKLTACVPREKEQDQQHHDRDLHTVLGGTVRTCQRQPYQWPTGQESDGRDEDHGADGQQHTADGEPDGCHGGQHRQQRPADDVVDGGRAYHQLTEVSVHQLHLHQHLGDHRDGTQSYRHTDEQREHRRADARAAYCLRQGEASQDTGAQRQQQSPETDHHDRLALPARELGV